ncbi:NAD(P)-binding protein [Corynespora cassiicola Philippines]|uniref:Short-chain dehydrogenase/reductase 3 n=1 Tax=Corynespora cassiicola Philippines TaxID=1448308 RepID=A0A2T2NSK4_CORCC|nr:NAD(P)-binding protein [Corynespora cassiicola Philippines]
MSAALHRISNLVSLSVSHIALNPVFTGALIWVLTKGPPAARDRVIARFASLRDPHQLAQIIKALKWLFALGLARRANQQLNKIALNAWRLKSERHKWNWHQEVAVVTGGCSGIGEAVVKRLNNKGVRVAVLDIQQLPASLQGYANIKFFACDITDPAAVESAAESIRDTMGPPSILVNNAGIAGAHTILKTSHEYLQKIFDVNLLSNFTTVKAFLPDMIAANKGHIITVASAASFLGVGGMVDYGCTKAAVLSFHEGLNLELKHRHKANGVLTTSIHPNWVLTPLIAEFEPALRARSQPLVEVSTVADAIVNQITNCSSAQVFIPHSITRVSGLRGWPNWMQELLRDSVTRAVLPAAP